MMLTKQLGALLAALALLLALAGCGAQTPDAPPTPPQSESIDLPAAGEAVPAVPDTAPQEPVSSAPDEPSAPPESGAETAESVSPQEPDNAPEPPAALTCTMSISCAVLLEHADALDGEKLELVPADGILFPASEMSFEEGESVFDLLKRVCRAQKIHMEFSETPLYGSAYIEGIGNLYEFDCGEGSGWMYRVNGAFPQVGCSQVVLSSGDTVEWLYTCDFGADIGGGEVGE